MLRIRVALIAVALLASAGCASRPESQHTYGGPRSQVKSSLRREIVAYQQVWAQGVGKVGYLITYEVSEGPDTPVTLYFVENLENVEQGWIAPDGHAMKFHVPEHAVASARRVPFEEKALPQDDLEAQIRRIFDLDPKTQLSFYAGR